MAVSAKMERLSLNVGGVDVGVRKKKMGAPPATQPNTWPVHGGSSIYPYENNSKKTNKLDKIVATRILSPILAGNE